MIVYMSGVAELPVFHWDWKTRCFRYFPKCFLIFLTIITIWIQDIDSTIAMKIIFQISFFDSNGQSIYLLYWDILFNNFITVHSLWMYETIIFAYMTSQEKKSNIILFVNMTYLEQSTYRLYVFCWKGLQTFCHLCFMSM